MKPISVPKIASVKYAKNFITTAVCEVRFPTLLELENKRPIEFQKAIRKEYPHYEQEISEGPGLEESLRQVKHLFKSKRKSWTVTLNSSSLALETSKYTEFEEFKERFDMILETVRNIIDSDFFTRVGLRYINTIPMVDGDLRGWLNKEISSIICDSVLGDIRKYASVSQGETEYGGYTFRQGFDLDKKSGTDLKYQLDFDYFNEGVDYDKTIELISNFNKTNFNLFSWCLGEKSIKWLGEGKKKKI